MGRTFLALLTLAFLTRVASAADPKPGRADFSGEWALDEGSSVDKGTNTDTARESPRPQAVGRGGSGAAGMPGADTSSDIPFEAMVDADRINVRDDGTKLFVVYVSGRQRVLFLDGEERELDDGGGPAKVTAKRKGERGEQIVVSSKWPRVGALAETWELQSAPRRLTVTAKGKGRQSFSYKRVYGPAPEVPATDQSKQSTTSATTPPSSETKSDASASTPAISLPWGKVECSIKPPRGATGAELVRLAKISSGDASTRASASVKPARVTSVISSDVEVHEGCLVFPIDVRLEGRKGVQEVFIDAGDGKVLGSAFEATESATP